MDIYSGFKNKVFSVNETNFDSFALDLFRYQAKNNKIYAKFIETLDIQVEKIKSIYQIPFIPIEFFKSHKVICEGFEDTNYFESSGTTSFNTSKHYITDYHLYTQSFLKTFSIFYGNPDEYTIIALTPTPSERKNSSLIFMLSELIRLSNKEESGFYLNNFQCAGKILQQLKGKKILIGLTYALMDFAETFPLSLTDTIIMETGGMKGKRTEIPRKELHQFLCKQFEVENIHSEYGMTELLSQSYSKGAGIFKTPPWMRIIIRDQKDPFSFQDINESGCINVIDLANISTCAFIATQDLGIIKKNGSFEVLGRTDNSEMRGCNLMI